jgi:hypothetical protein
LTSALERGGWSAPRPGRFSPGKDPVPIVQEAGWAPGPVWTCAKNLTRTGNRSPDRPARSQSLYRLSYPGPYISILCFVVKYSKRLINVYVYNNYSVCTCLPVASSLPVLDYLKAYVILVYIRDERKELNSNTHTHTHTHIYIYICCY